MEQIVFEQYKWFTSELPHNYSVGSYMCTLTKTMMKEKHTVVPPSQCNIVYS